MQNTIIAVYDRFTNAQAAMQALLDSGFTRGSVQLNPHAGSTGVERASSVAGGFFRTIFGAAERDQRDMYAEAIRRGSSMLTVEADSDQQRELAISILVRFDPVDMDRRVAHWRDTGWSGYDESTPMLSDSEIETERANYHPVRAPDTGDAVASTPVRVLRKMSVDAAQAGLGPVARNSDFGDTLAASDDADFRQHWRNVYAARGTRYEDYDAAYRYGSSVAGNARFRHYRWEDVEPQLRDDWEKRNPQQAWDRVSDAVRFGAEKVIGRDRRKN